MPDSIRAVARLLTPLLTLLLTMLLTVAAGVAPARAASPPPPKDETQVAVTFAVRGCEGCRIGLVSAVWPDEAGVEPDVWNGPRGRVRGGEVTLSVPADRTRGLSATIVRPWEESLGYVTEVVWSYRGHDVGTRVPLREARRQRRASTCWAGTDRSAVTIPLVVREVQVRGVGGRTSGTLAYARRTLETMPPRARAHDGVVGTQDVSTCGTRARP